MDDPQHAAAAPPPPREHTRQGYTISTDPARLDVPAIHAFLTQSYWAKGVPRAVVERSIAHSLCFGVYDPAGAQVGFARAISDRATFAYLSDVYILPAQRGRGLSKWLLACILADPELAGLRRWGLATADAHGLYAQHGFTPLASPEMWMEIYNSKVYAG